MFTYKMKKILAQVSALDYKKFRKIAIEKCKWTADQYANRLSGVTKLTPAEEFVLQEIVKELNCNK